MKNWEIQNTTQSSENVLDILISSRGLSTEQAIAEFLSPPPISEIFDKLNPDFTRALGQAAAIIRSVVELDIPIVIHGDYDADGICATAILYKTIVNELGHKKTINLIPNRFEHGYGLSIGSIDASIARIKEAFDYTGEILFITVDSGITAVSEVEYLNSLGHTIVITDHHQKPAQLPNAKTIVWEDAIVGSSIAWFLAHELGSKDAQSIVLAALATITDIQPVLGINRTIVKTGLEILNSNPPVGLKALIDIIGKNRAELTTYDLGWVIGPRLNASGRLVDAEESLKLLMADDYATALHEAENLNRINTDRQDKTLEMYDIANSINNHDMPKIIISHSSDYHEGIIGLVAARLVKTYFRPAIVISTSEVDEEAKGSVRSVPGINIIEVLRKHEDLFINVGGHPLAAGFSIQKTKIPEFEERLVHYAEEHFDDQLLQPALYIDVQLPLELINLEFLSEIDKLKPFGVGNREPVFMSSKVGISAINFVGRDQKHASLGFYINGKKYRGIFFGGLDTCIDLKIGDIVDIVYTINLNEYHGDKSVNLAIKDLRKSDD